MKKKFLSFILAICLLIPCSFALTACGSNPPDDPHTHNWSTTWSRNSSEHWLTCDGCDEKKDKASHDGDICSVCGYDTNHICEYGNTYLNDSTGHWQQCDICEETTIKENHDGTICSICGYDNTLVVNSVRDLEVITFDTGSEGLFTLVLLPDGKNMLIDSGMSDLETEMLIEDQLTYVYNVTTIDYFVLTNTNPLRTGEMAYVLQNYNVSNLFTPRVIRIEGQQHDDSYVNDCYLDALQYVPNTCNTIEVAENNCDITNSFKKSGSATTYSYTIDFMLPVSTEDCQNNTWHSDAMGDTTIVISIEYQGKTILITSDVRQRNTQGYIDNYDGEKDVDVLITTFEASDPYAITNSPSFAGKSYFESISLEAGDYAIITPISSATRVDVLDTALRDLLGRENALMLTEGNDLYTAYVKINSSGQITVTVE